jgi:hypothetical protein
MFNLPMNLNRMGRLGEPECAGQSGRRLHRRPELRRLVLPVLSPSLRCTTQSRRATSKLRDETIQHVTS